MEIVWERVPNQGLAWTAKTPVGIAIVSRRGGHLTRDFFVKVNGRTVGSYIKNSDAARQRAEVVLNELARSRGIA